MQRSLEAGGGLPYKTTGVEKKPLGGTKILFCGRGTTLVSPLSGTSSHIMFTGHNVL